MARGTARAGSIKAYIIDLRTGKTRWVAPTPQAADWFVALSEPGRFLILPSLLALRHWRSAWKQAVITSPISAGAARMEHTR